MVIIILDNRSKFFINFRVFEVVLFVLLNVLNVMFELWSDREKLVRVEIV